MKRHLLIIFAMSASLIGWSLTSANAFGAGRGHAGRGVGFNHGFARGGFGGGFGIGGGCYGWDIAELYNELYQNLPYFALHPPVYYSYPVPRTYGYSPFAYPPGVMTPDIVENTQPVTIVNPYVPGTKPASNDANADRSASTASNPEPLVVINPYVSSAAGSVAQNGL
jgi:hypothetical protein